MHPKLLKHCPRHGLTEHHLEKNHKPKRTYLYYRCYQCRYEQKETTRRGNKAKLVEEAGGQCRKCGYNRCIKALHFHHLDPSKKSFNLGEAQRSLFSLRKEAEKCILLCAVCHIELEAGIFTLDDLI